MAGDTGWGLWQALNWLVDDWFWAHLSPAHMGKARNFEPASYFRFALARRTARSFTRSDTKGSSRMMNLPTRKQTAGSEREIMISISSPPLGAAQRRAEWWIAAEYCDGLFWVQKRPALQWAGLSRYLNKQENPVSEPGCFGRVISAQLQLTRRWWHGGEAWESFPKNNETQRGSWVVIWAPQKWPAFSLAGRGWQHSEFFESESCWIFASPALETAKPSVRAGLFWASKNELPTD